MITAIDQGRYLRSLAQRTAPTTQAAYDAPIDGSAAWFILAATKGRVRASLGNVAGALTPGQIVTLIRQNHAGASSLTEFVVSAPTTSATGNSSSSTPSSSSFTGSGASISQIPVSVALTRGGAAQTVLIYGTGFGSAPTYGDPGITDNVAPVVTATLITIQVKASGGMAIGTYSLIFGSLSVPNFFVVS